MAFGGKKKSGGGGGQRGDVRWWTLAKILNSKNIDERTGKPKKYVQADKYKCRLILQVVDHTDEIDSLEDGELFVINTANYFDKGDKDPDFVFKRLVTNLNDDKAVTAISASGTKPKKKAPARSDDDDDDEEEAPPPKKKKRRPAEDEDDDPPY
jgi:hypothetical protein